MAKYLLILYSYVGGIAFGLSFYYFPLLKKKGIYNPAFALTLAVCYAVIDILGTISLFFMGEDVVLDETVLVFKQLILWGVMWLLCKIFLPKIDNRRLRKTSIHTNYHKWAVWTVVYCCIYPFIIFLLVGIPDFTNFESAVTLLLAVLFIALGARMVYVLINRYEEIKTEAERTLEELETHKAPIVFLRSFLLDKKPIKGRTFDEYICANFAMSRQPIISLSDPDDFLPTGGSIKIQSTDDDWEKAINTLLATCRAVVFFEGKSDSLLVEMGKIRALNIPHDKIFIATPPQRYRVAAWCESNGRKYVLNYVWSNFAKSMEESAGIHGLPEKDPGECKIFTVDKKWNCSNEPVIKKDMEFFEYIMQQTIHYEESKCDYSKLASKLREYELTLLLSNAENNKLKKAVVCVVALSLVLSPLVVFLSLLLSKS